MAQLTRDEKCINMMINQTSINLAVEFIKTSDAASSIAKKFGEDLLKLSAPKSRSAKPYAGVQIPPEILSKVSLAKSSLDDQIAQQKADPQAFKEYLKDPIFDQQLKLVDKYTNLPFKCSEPMTVEELSIYVALLFTGSGDIVNLFKDLRDLAEEYYKEHPNEKTG